MFVTDIKTLIPISFAENAPFQAVRLCFVRGLFLSCFSVSVFPIDPCPFSRF